MSEGVLVPVYKPRFNKAGKLTGYEWENIDEFLITPAPPPVEARPDPAGAGPVALYVPMPLTADGDGPADPNETVRVEHQIWDAETNGTLAVAVGESVARWIVERLNAPTQPVTVEEVARDGADMLSTLADILERQAVAAREHNRRGGHEWEPAPALVRNARAKAQAILNTLNGSAK